MQNCEIWVVAKLVWGQEPTGEADAIPVVEESGYFDKRFAEKRAKHIRDNDGKEAWVYPVRFYWPFAPIPTVPPAPPSCLVPGALTTTPGLELHAYHVPGRNPQPSLAQTVSATWTAWRQAQAERGNLDEAGQEQPSIQTLNRLYDENPAHHPMQLELPMPGLEAPSH
jgi:hypothetical protein